MEIIPSHPVSRCGMVTNCVRLPGRHSFLPYCFLHPSLFHWMWAENHTSWPHLPTQKFLTRNSLISPTICHMDLLGREGYSKNGKTLSGMKESHSLTTNVINYAVVHHNEKLDSYHLYASYDLYTCYRFYIIPHTLLTCTFTCASSDVNSLSGWIRLASWRASKKKKIILEDSICFVVDTI